MTNSTNSSKVSAIIDEIFELLDADYIFKLIDSPLEEAVESLHISVATLGRYENGESEPNPDVVHAMSKVYENPALRRKYCSECCLIGKEAQPSLPSPEHHITKPSLDATTS